MKTTLRKLGNSRGVLIPAALLAACEIKDEIELRLENGRIVIEPFRPARTGWAEAAAEIVALGEDARIWPEFGNDGDKEWEW